MIHVCSLARLHATVDETRARHIVTLLRLTDRVERPRHIAAGKPSHARGRRYRHADGRLHRAGRRARRAADRIRRQLGPRGADGGALLCRHQPLDRRRLCRRLRAQSGARRTGNRAGHQARLAHRAAERARSSRSPTACSSATAAWCARSRPSAPAISPRKACRSGSILTKRFARLAPDQRGGVRDRQEIRRGDAGHSEIL